MGRLCKIVRAMGLMTTIAGANATAAVVDETVYVETPTDTDGDGRLDRVYVRIARTATKDPLPSILTMTPYAVPNTNVPFHNVDVASLPQDHADADHEDGARSVLGSKVALTTRFAIRQGYASLAAHSVGTGNSTGCPTVGDMSETLAAKAVIDWLNGRARAYSSRDGTKLMRADWADGKVGMIGTSYNGTLPIMVATTGVEGLKAIVPVAAISNWYNYYRAGGLVVGPGGYVGEDADVLAKFINVRGRCGAEINAITRGMGREHGDYDGFWRERNYLPRAHNINAAVFIHHGQADWNVRQRHAIELWHALPSETPRRLWLHRGGHSEPNRADYEAEVWKWFDRYVRGVGNGVEQSPPIEVQYPNGRWVTQESWPHEETASDRLYFGAGSKLVLAPPGEETVGFTDTGKRERLSVLVQSPEKPHDGRLAFLADPFARGAILSGTPEVRLRLAITNRHAANLTVALVAYGPKGDSQIVTRGWFDPQNHADLSAGESLVPATFYDVSFPLEPKQFVFEPGSRLGIVIAQTDFDHTLRPDPGTELQIQLGEESYVTLSSSTALGH